jgi:hypothetical protein
MEATQPIKIKFFVLIGSIGLVLIAVAKVLLNVLKNIFYSPEEELHCR